MKLSFLRAFIGALMLLPTISHACSSCGCTLSSDWDSQGFATKSGFRFDVRFDFLDQSQLRSGTDTVDRSLYPPPQDLELEQGTINRYTTLGFDYSPNSNWGVNLQVPYLDRSHTTIPEGETSLSFSHSSSIGDARLLVRYQGLTPQKNVGLQFVLKWPTGAHDVVFASGTEAGEPLDRGLQPGSGTTDLLLGIYRFGTLNQDWDYFAQALAQIPLDSQDGFRPGDSLNANFGLRYVANETVVPEIQINSRVVRRDSGIDADADNSGGTLVDLSPGMSVKVGDKMSLFGFVQVPLWQRVNGLQLAPHYTVSIGARYDFR
jgi:hypothetical protein